MKRNARKIILSTKFLLVGNRNSAPQNEARHEISTLKLCQMLII